MVRTFRKVYIELVSYFLFLQEQIKDIIIMYTPGSTPSRNGGITESEPAVGDGVRELAWCYPFGDYVSGNDATSATLVYVRLDDC